MKYLLDFDDTLYDSKSFKAVVANEGAEHLLFTPEIWERYDVREYLFSDTVPWLRSKSKADLHILTSVVATQGTFEAYQREKLRSSGLAALVASVTFTAREKGEGAAEIASRFPPSEPIIFVDNRIDHCLSVKAALPQATCCLMVRDLAVIGDVKEVQGMPVVHTLAEVDGIIEES